MTAVLGKAFGSVPAGEPINLSTLEFDVLWEHLGLGEMPLVLRVPSPGRTFTERRQLIGSAWRDLERRGLGRSVEPLPTLVGMLQVLATADQEIDGRFGATRGVRLLVAAAGDNAVFAVLSKHGLTLSQIPATGLAHHALSVLPNAGAGPGASITVRSTELDEAAAEAATPAEFDLALRRRGVPARDAGILRLMVTKVQRHGQFGASARTRLGHRCRAPHVIGFVDTEAGRYIQMRRTTTDGTAWSTISPADNRLLAQRLSELLTEVAESAAQQRLG